MQIYLQFSKREYLRQQVKDANKCKENLLKIVYGFLEHLENQQTSKRLF